MVVIVKASVYQGLDVLGEAGAAIAAACIEELGADSGISTNTLADRLCPYYFIFVMIIRRNNPKNKSLPFLLSKPGHGLNYLSADA